MMKIAEILENDENNGSCSRMEGSWGARHQRTAGTEGLEDHSAKKEGKNSPN